MPDDVPAPFDPAGILRVLDDHGVDFVLIGGVAARLHGSPTLTEDEIGRLSDDGGDDTH